MKYLVNGGGDELASLQMPEITSLLSDLDVKRIVICVLALKHQWHFKDASTERLGGLAQKFDVKLLSEHTIASAKEWIDQADAIFFTGGGQRHLLQRLQDHDLTQSIQESENLKVIGGLSAGEMSLGSRTIIGKYEVLDIVDGLGYVQNTIFDSHFANRNRQDRLKSVQEKLKNIRAIGIDENTWLRIGEDGGLQGLCGEGAAYVYTESGEEKYDSKSLPF